MRKKSYFSLLDVWRTKYPLPQRYYDPVATKVRLTCEKCGSHKCVQRHHKGHEFFLAILNEREYAPRYIQFLPQDVVPLCSYHHRRIHTLSEPIIDRLRLILRGYNGKPVEKSVLETFRQELILYCNKWLARKGKKR